MREWRKANGEEEGLSRGRRGCKGADLARARGHRLCRQGRTQNLLPPKYFRFPGQPRKGQEDTPASSVRSSGSLRSFFERWRTPQSTPPPWRPPRDSETERQRETRSQREKARRRGGVSKGAREAKCQSVEK